MNAQRSLSCLIVVVGLVSPGCAVESTENVLDESLFVPLDPMGGPSDPEDDPPGSGNGFLPACFWDPNVIEGLRKYAVQQLWNAPMGADHGTLPPNSTMDLVPPDCRAEALKYLARCTLPKDTYAVDPVTGDEYWGWLGLSTPWLTGTFPPDDQWWVTGCLIQHLNAFDVEVPILLDGERPGLYDPDVAHPDFQPRDSRVWGNVFDMTTDFVANVCYESDLLGSCPDTSIIDTRICDSDPTVECNLNIVGPCEDACIFSVDSGTYNCGTGGAKNVGSRLKDFVTLYGDMCSL